MKRKTNWLNAGSLRKSSHGGRIAKTGSNAGHPESREAKRRKEREQAKLTREEPPTGCDYGIGG